jgi:hypothetical protein
VELQIALNKVSYETKVQLPTKYYHSMVMQF